jgi:hypothetical protein
MGQIAYPRFVFGTFRGGFRGGQKEQIDKLLIVLVGAAGIEPATSPV